MAFIPLYLIDQHHLSTASAAIWLGIIRAAGILGSLLGGWLSDKWGRKRAIFLALVATGPTVFLYAHLPFNAALVLILIIYGMLMAMRETTVQTFLMSKTPLKLQGTVFGIYFGFSMEGTSLLQPVVGNFMDIMGIAVVFHIVSLLSIGLSLIAAFMARKL